MQHSNHRTAALIASKPARIITSAVLAVALTATPMLSPVAAYAASQATQDQLSAAPVSYTHLDVYKRQLLVSFSKRSFLFPWAFLNIALRKRLGFRLSVSGRLSWENVA